MVISNSISIISSSDSSRSNEDINFDHLFHKFKIT